MLSGIGARAHTPLIHFSVVSIHSFLFWLIYEIIMVLSGFPVYLINSANFLFISRYCFIISWSFCFIDSICLLILHDIKHSWATLPFHSLAFFPDLVSRWPFACYSPTPLLFGYRTWALPHRFFKTFSSLVLQMLRTFLSSSPGPSPWHHFYRFSSQARAGMWQTVAFNACLRKEVKNGWNLVWAEWLFFWILFAVPDLKLTP